MVDLTNLSHIKRIQGEMRMVFDSPSGKEVLEFLEQIAGWYDFNDTDRDQILVSHGKRQLLASIKTLLKHSAEDIQLVAKQKEQ